MKDRKDQATKMVADMLFPGTQAPTQEHDAHIRGDMAADSHLAGAVQELYRQHPRTKEK